MTLTKLFSALLLTVTIVAAVALAPKPEISNAWMRPNGEGMTTAAYVTITNKDTKADTLYAIETNLATRTELHESYQKDGKTKMRKVDFVVIPAKKTVEMKPGGLHIMLIKLKQDIIKKEKHDLVFKFRRAGSIKVTVVATDKAPGKK
ncbi:MAG: copper chaperone PCu(A)C [Ignavibacteriales bacterium]|nr:MAG: copper chaperone PCu(A)C [Ignavibacteriaceae bacterium]MBW7871909.1 copper chaperone PCu(A)C [Ignavibacteria bacterium]MCZ2144241.1 copper chaperone PCu(A)C [Ignavibacteriales bacterium]OQY73242.1 MAG: hypothetical protein B6D45_08330 [Ignavibacteriales bacterium UTCHB3]MBV6446194.1 hypothetical protein [Ignavibacteriaceae bacterium]